MPDMSNREQFENPSDFERHLKYILEQDGYSVELAPRNTPYYDMTLSKGSDYIAVQVKNRKAPVYLPDFRRFIHFLEQPQASKFTKGFFISGSGFAGTVKAHIDTNDINNVLLGTHSNGRIDWYPSPHTDTPTPPPTEKIYIGVFTCKGGVGKTTVSAHLAGAFALTGYSVLLLDLDRQGHLSKLLGEGVYVPRPRGEVGTTITVLKHDVWDESEWDEHGIVICDCNPEFDANPKDLIEKFDYCIVPTTLNPLGINKNADVIQETFSKIREVNQKSELLVLINNLHTAQRKRNEVLNGILKNELSRINDPNYHYIDPLSDEGVSIRFSDQLLYWGYDTIIANQEPQLAFQLYGGRSYPRDDFNALADYIGRHTDIQRLKL